MVYRAYFGRLEISTRKEIDMFTLSCSDCGESITIDVDDENSSQLIEDFLTEHEC